MPMSMHRAVLLLLLLSCTPSLAADGVRCGPGRDDPPEAGFIAMVPRYNKDFEKVSASMTDYDWIKWDQTCTDEPPVRCAAAATATAGASALPCICARPARELKRPVMLLSDLLQERQV